MSSRRFRSGPLTAILSVVAASTAMAAEPATSSDAKSDAQTAQTMDQLVSTLEYLLPVSYDRERFSSPAERQPIHEHLRLLATEASRLEAHAASRDVTFGSLSRSFADDARLAFERFDEGRADETRFLLHEMTDACVACHSRLPDAPSRAIGRRIADTETVQNLPLPERVRILAATRQFDRALDAYEALFVTERISPSELDLGGYLDTYVELCLRVRRDPARPRRALEALAARPDVTPAHRAVLEDWIASLKVLEQRKPLPSPLDESSALLELAAADANGGDDRRALVYYVAASGELHRFVAQGDLTPAQQSQAYYQLGLVESRVGRAFWLSETEDLLEASIRADPAGPWAQQALQLLEEFLTAGYTGSATDDIPPEVRARLTELQQLIEDARSS